MASKKPTTTTQPVKTRSRIKRPKEDPVAQPVEIVPSEARRGSERSGPTQQVEPTSKKSRMVKGSEEAKEWSKKMMEIRRLKKLEKDQKE
jgi:hypothetical protein